MNIICYLNIYLSAYLSAHAIGATNVSTKLSDI